MVLVHFVTEGDAKPICRSANGEEWFWARTADAVTCPLCLVAVVALVAAPVPSIQTALDAGPDPYILS